MTEEPQVTNEHTEPPELTDRDREILVMRHLEEMSAAEIGSILGISEGAVRVRLLRSLTRLRALLDDGGSEALP